MPIAISYINGIVILPDSRILTTRKTRSKQTNYIDTYRVTFQCALFEDENETQCLSDEVKKLFGLDIFSSPYSNLVNTIRTGYIHRVNYTFKILVYIIQITDSITLNTNIDYEVRPLAFETAFNESLISASVSYKNNSDPLPEYTHTAEFVLQEIKTCGGINKMKDKGRCIKSHS